MYTSINYPSKTNNDDVIWIMSGDIGKRNFGVIINEYKRSEISMYVNNDRKLVKPPRKLDKIELDKLKLDKIRKCCNGKTIMMDLRDFVGKPNLALDQDIFVNMNIYLTNIKPWLDLCLCFVLEDQLQTNYEAGLMEQHIYSWLTIQYSLKKDIIRFGSRLKYSEMGIPKTIKKKYYRKYWGCIKVYQILMTRSIQCEKSSEINAHGEKRESINYIEEINSCKTPKETIKKIQSIMKTIKTTMTSAVKLSKRTNNSQSSQGSNISKNILDDIKQFQHISQLDRDMIEYIFIIHKSKMDDVNDCLLQCFSFCKRVFVDGYV